MRATKPAIPSSHAASAIYMDTLVTIEIVDPAPEVERAAATARAFGWFERVERTCSRFDEKSELTALSRAETGRPTEVSALLFKQLEFALAVAEASDGAFDPTVGGTMEARGFDRNYATGERIASPRSPGASSFRDVLLDPERLTVTLLRPLTLDLGAVAKGFAIDLAAQELSAFGNFAINAGGDVLVRGRNHEGAPWRIGVRHPRENEAIFTALRLTEGAVCTSGDYERQGATGGAGHHILDPATGRSAGAAVSVTVIAPSAMVADALSTAAFALGPERGLALLERHGVDGIIITSNFETLETPGIKEYR